MADSTTIDPSSDSTTTSTSTTTTTTATETTGDTETSTCGDGVVEAEEECDGLDWNGATCESLGWVPGELSCTGECQFDVSGCAPEGMVLVEPGEFEMGSVDVPPIRQVTLSAYWIDSTEVTTEAYEQCVMAGACDAPGTGDECNWMVPGRSQHPINCVTWHRAQDYCTWMGKRLPTEAEWEKAARGADARSYPWGEEAATCDYTVKADADLGGEGCGLSSTWPVGQKPAGASPYGALDMAGNLIEWVADWGGPYDPSDTVDPLGPRTGDRKVRRGGSWKGVAPEGFLAAGRSWILPGVMFDYMGFRCAMTVD